MTNQRLKFELVDFTQVVIGADPAEGAIIIGRTAEAQSVDLHLTPAALVKLEAFLARANVEQAKRQPSH